MPLGFWLAIAGALITYFGWPVEPKLHTHDKPPDRPQDHDDYNGWKW